MNKFKEIRKNVPDDRIYQLSRQMQESILKRKVGTKYKYL